jgi:hypothetical protein
MLALRLEERSCRRRCTLRNCPDRCRCRRIACRKMWCMPFHHRHRKFRSRIWLRRDIRFRIFRNSADPKTHPSTRAYKRHRCTVLPCTQRRNRRSCPNHSTCRHIRRSTQRAFRGSRFQTARRTGRGTQQRAQSRMRSQLKRSPTSHAKRSSRRFTWLSMPRLMSTSSKHSNRRRRPREAVLVSLREFSTRHL